jgi:plasmid stabilization system protein ParE
MKNYVVVFTPRVERQLVDLYADIADRGGQARAESFIGGIVADCLSLSTFPERGRKRDDIRPNLRVKGYKRRVSIAFSVDAGTRTVAIHGAFYGGQDFETLLREVEGDD